MTKTFNYNHFKSWRGAFSKYRFKLLLNSTWAIPIVVLLRLLRPFLLIRICRIFSERIGHFTADIAEHLARQNFKDERTLDIFYFGAVANTQWERMARRSSLKIVGPWISYVAKWNRLIPGGDSHILQSSMTRSRDIEGLFQKFDCSIPFLATETKIAETWLESKGWTRGEPFVILNVRYSEYLEREYPGTNWDFHSYRNSNIQTYLAAMEWLATQGVWVIRVGKHATQRFESKSPLIIDYAFDSERSDLLDIWLCSNASGIISTASGLDYLAGIYRKPQLLINAMPLIAITTFLEMIWVPKHLKWSNGGKDLTLKEMLENSFYETDQYHNAGIAIVDLNEREILESVMEFWHRIEHKWESSAEGDVLAEEFWKIFESATGFFNHHGWLHPQARVGTSWLITMGEGFLR